MRSGQGLERLIFRVIPHLQANAAASSHLPKRHVGWSAEEIGPSGRRAYDATTPLTVVLETGGEVFKALEQAVAATPQARRYWGDMSRHLMIGRALDAVAHERLDAAGAAAALAAELDTLPPATTYLFRTFGIAPDAPTTIAGVTFCFRDPVRFAHLLDVPPARIRFGFDPRTPFNGDAVAIVRAPGDGQRGPANALERLRVAMAIAACIAADRSEIGAEVSFGLGDTDFGEAMVFEEQSAFVTDPHGEIHPALWTGQEEIDAALRERPGLKELSELAALIPLDPRGASLDFRLLRAALALAESFSGQSAERLLWRWIAIEAALGDSQPELTERLADRVAVLTVPDGSLRAERKHAVRRLYRLRNAIAHGTSLSAPDEDDAARVRALAVSTLEAASAHRAMQSDQKLFDALEVARYTATSV